MKSEPEGKSTVREIAYRDYVDGEIKRNIQLNFLMEFSWKIVDEDLYLLATGDIFPMSRVKDNIGIQAKIDITKKLDKPAGSIPEAEIPPSELIPGIIEEVNKELIGCCGVEITDIRFVQFSVSDSDKMKIHQLERDRERAKAYSEIAETGNPVVIANAIQSGYLTAKPQEKVAWLCKCGAKNKTNFCSECGAPKDFFYWICSCGTKNHGKFCIECGRKLEEY